MNDTNELLLSIKRASIDAVEASKPVNILFGTVISAIPLSISVEQKMRLTSAQLILTRNVSKYKSKMTFDDTSLKQPIAIDDTLIGNKYTGPDGIVEPISIEKNGSNGLVGDMRFTSKIEHEVTIDNSLKSGDEVILLRQQGGQKFIVIDKVNV